ncbi:hypothetical protein Tco_0638986 [Tanacetum coccineum]
MDSGPGSTENFCSVSFQESLRRSSSSLLFLDNSSPRQDWDLIEAKTSASDQSSWNQTPTIDFSRFLLIIFGYHEPFSVAVHEEFIIHVVLTPDVNPRRSTLP